MRRIKCIVIKSVVEFSIKVKADVSRLTALRQRCAILSAIQSREQKERPAEPVPNQIAEHRMEAEVSMPTSQTHLYRRTTKLDGRVGRRSPDSPAPTG